MKEIDIEQYCDGWTVVVNAAVEAERKACAQLVENYALQYAEPVWALKLTEAIRARG